MSMIFFYHIYLARVSRLMPNKFWLFVHQPGQHKQKHQQVYKVRAFTASNKCRAVSFDARSSLMFSLIWIGAA